MCIGRIRMDTYCTHIREITNFALGTELEGPDSKNGLFTLTGLKCTRTAHTLLGLVTAPAVHGRVIEPPGKECITPAPVDNGMRSVGKRVSPLAKAGGDFLVAYDLFVVSAL
jgi:hypothetical protein